MNFGKNDNALAVSSCVSCRIGQQSEAFIPSQQNKLNHVKGMSNFCENELIRRLKLLNMDLLFNLTKLQI